MAIGIRSIGGDAWRANLPASKEEAQQALAQIQTHLSRPGKASGVLTLVNRTKADGELSLTRKNAFQLWGRGGGNQRLNDTTFAIGTLLRNAGLTQAEQELNQYLSQDPKRHGNRVSAREMLALLNAHLAKPDAESEHMGGQEPAAGLAHPDLPKPPANALVEEGTMSVLRELMQQSQSSGDIPDIDDLEPTLAKGWQQLASPPPALEPLKYPGSDLYPAKAEGRSLNEVLKNAKIVISDDKSGGDPALGQGTFGIVKQIQMEGSAEALVIKTFKADEATTLTLQRGHTGNEAMAAYLTSKRDPDYGRKINVVQPEYFLISSGGRFLMVDPLGLRALIKASPANQIKCHGLVMKKAPGEEVAKQEKHLTLEHKKQVFKGTLDAIRQLNNRGFTHRDIKPANTFFDPQTAKVSLIDTGMLNKATKSDPASRQMTARAGSPAFMHPRVMTGKPYGTEADLYSAAMMALDLIYPSVKNEAWKFAAPIYKKIREGEFVNPQDRFFDKVSLITRIETTLAEATELNRKRPGAVDEVALNSFLTELKDPNSFASYLVDCFEMATAEPPKQFVRSARGAAAARAQNASTLGVNWKDPTKSNAAYERLIADPRLQT